MPANNVNPRRLPLLPSTLLITALLLSGCNPTPPEHPFLPWEVTEVDQGISVFGVHLGKTSLLEIRQMHDMRAELAVFQAPDGTLALEAFFGRVRLGPLEAQIIAVAEASQEQLQALIVDSATPTPQPSGSWRFELTYDAIREAQHYPVRSLSYVPTATYDEELVVRRFGTPDRTLTTQDGSQHWLYPTKGTMVSFSSRGKNIFQYIDPAQFDSLVETIHAPVERP